jgi:hypothetical protein
MNATLTRVACALVIAALSGVFWVGRAQSQTTYAITLSHAEESVDPVGRAVITMMARGDLQGALTVRLDRSADGTVTGGEWALTVSYTEVIATPPASSGGDDDPGERLVQKGVLKGTVTGGSVTLNDDGSVGTLNGVQLVLTGGTLAYDGTASGSGSIDGTSLADRDNSSGSISLVF